MELNQKEPSTIKPWLLVALIVVILAGIGFFAWINSSQSKTETVAPVAETSTPATAVTTPVTTTPAVVSTADWKTYENKDLGFSFKYPSDWFVTWEKAQGEQLADVTIGSENSASPMEQSVNAFNLDIQVLDSTDKNLDYWTGTMPRSGKTASVTQKADIVVDEIAGIKQFEDTNIQGFEGSPSYIGATYLIKNNKLYLITLMAKNKTVYESKSGLLNQILSTFKFN